jgi:hypothetical protein
MNIEASCAFEADCPEPSEVRAPGRSWGRALQRTLSSPSSAAQIELWKDCGWVIYFEDCGLPVQVMFAKYFPNRPWALYVCVADSRPFLRRLFNRTPRLNVQVAYRISKAVHAFLLGHLTARSVRWSLTGNAIKAGTSSLEDLNWPSGIDMGA